MSAELTPYISVRNARGAIDWYTDALGARLVGEPVVMPDGRIGHAVLDVAGARLYLADAHPEIGVVAPDATAHTFSLVLTVPDVDTAMARAEAQGATVERPATDEPYGRIGVLVDPYGHRWMLENHTPEEQRKDGRPRPGDTVHLTLEVRDGARARDFYEAVLDWSFSPTASRNVWEADGPTPTVGIFGDWDDPPGVVPTYTVDDIEVAVAAVQTAGGSAGEIEQLPLGRTSLCRDDQGLSFRVVQLD